MGKERKGTGREMKERERGEGRGMKGEGKEREGGEPQIFTWIDAYDYLLCLFAYAYVLQYYIVNKDEYITC